MQHKECEKIFANHKTNKKKKRKQTLSKDWQKN